MADEVYATETGRMSVPHGCRARSGAGAAGALRVLQCCLVSSILALCLFSKSGVACRHDSVSVSSQGCLRAVGIVTGECLLCYSTIAGKAQITDGVWGFWLGFVVFVLARVFR